VAVINTFMEDLGQSGVENEQRQKKMQVEVVKSKGSSGTGCEAATVNDAAIRARLEMVPCGALLDIVWIVEGAFGRRGWPGS